MEFQTHTRFMDMHSGGRVKFGFEYLYIPLPKREAIAWFENKYGDPYHTTCPCCGNDFSVDEITSQLELDKSIARDGRWGGQVNLQDTSDAMLITPSPDATLKQIVTAANTLGLEPHILLTRSPQRRAAEMTIRAIHALRTRKSLRG